MVIEDGQSANQTSKSYFISMCSCTLNPLDVTEKNEWQFRQLKCDNNFFCSKKGEKKATNLPSITWLDKEIFIALTRAKSILPRLADVTSKSITFQC